MTITTLMVAVSQSAKEPLLTPIASKSIDVRLLVSNHLVMTTIELLNTWA